MQAMLSKKRTNHVTTKLESLVPSLNCIKCKTDTSLVPSIPTYCVGDDGEVYFCIQVELLVVFGGLWKPQVLGITV